MALCVRVISSLTASSSWVAVTLTVWAVFQFVAVKVSALLPRVMSASSWPVILTVVVAVGWLDSFTV